MGGETISTQGGNLVDLSINLGAALGIAVGGLCLIAILLSCWRYVSHVAHVKRTNDKAKACEVLNHLLKPAQAMTVDENKQREVTWGCDKCGKQFPQGVPINRCFLCHLDFCDECRDSGNRPEQGVLSEVRTSFRRLSNFNAPSLGNLNKSKNKPANLLIPQDITRVHAVNR